MPETENICTIRYSQASCQAVLAEDVRAMPRVELNRGNRIKISNDETGNTLLISFIELGLNEVNYTAFVLKVTAVPLKAWQASTSDAINTDDTKQRTIM